MKYIGKDSLSQHSTGISLNEKYVKAEVVAEYSSVLPRNKFAASSF